MEQETEFIKADKTRVCISQNPKLFKFCNGIIGRKISAALEYAADASIYSREDTIKEMTTSQSVVLTFLYGLISEDIGLAGVIAEEGKRVEQMKSTYLKVWLKDDFLFPKKDIARGFTFLRKIQDVESLQIQQQLLDIISPLRNMYDVRVRRNGIVKMPDFVIDSIRKWTPSTNKEMEEKEQKTKTVRVLYEKDDTCKLKETHEIETNEKIVNPLLNQSALGRDDSDLDKTKIDSVHSPATITFQMSTQLSTEVLDVLEQTPSKDSKTRGLVRIPHLKKDCAKDSAFTMLHLSAAKGYKHGVSWELDRGVDIDLSTFNGMTALHLAAQNGWLDIAFLLLVRGAKFNARNDLGKTALHLAVERGHLAVVTLLIYHGADIKAKAKNGSTPLSIAIDSNHTKIVEFLKWKGAI